MLTFFLRMLLKKSFNFCIMILWLTLFSLCCHTTNSESKHCEMKGIVDDKIKCILHHSTVANNSRNENIIDEDAVDLDVAEKIVNFADKTEMHSKNTLGLDTNKTFFKGGTAEEFENYLHQLLPGIRFCSEGAINAIEDLGRFSGTQICCRAHAICTIDPIYPSETKHKLRNNGLFARSHCECDKKFYDCLKEVNTVLSKKIGFTFFTVLGLQCFKEEFPITGCLRKEEGRCVEYKFNTQGKKIYQWFDNPKFLV